VADYLPDANGTLQKAGDIILRNGTVVEVKTLTWENLSYQKPFIRQQQTAKIVKQLDESLRDRYPAQPIEYAFNGKSAQIWEELKEALKKRGITKIVGMDD
jgi:hypothetical protein